MASFVEHIKFYLNPESHVKASTQQQMSQQGYTMSSSLSYAANLVSRLHKMLTEKMMNQQIQKPKTSTQATNAAYFVAPVLGLVQEEVRNEVQHERQFESASHIDCGSSKNSSGKNNTTNPIGSFIGSYWNKYHSIWGSRPLVMNG